MKKSLLIHPDELTHKWVDRMVGLGVDTLVLHPVGGKKADQSLTDLLEKLADPAYRAQIDDAIDAGLSVEYALHAGSYLLPRGLYDVHSDWFRMDGEGKRCREINFCPANPEALAYFVDRAVELAQQLYRSAPTFYFWLDDAKDSTCKCPACAGLSASDQQLLVMNAVVTALREKIPGARLAHLAYYGTLTPPTTVKPAPGIFVEFAPIERDFTRFVRDSAPEYEANLRALLAYFGREEARVLEYWYDNSLFSRWKKPPKPFAPNNAIIRDDIAYYRALGFQDIACFACYLGEDYEALYGEPDVSAYAD